MEIKEYKNSLIAFDFDNEMVNATDMLKNFPSKRMNDFLRLKQTKEYIEYLKTKTGNTVIHVKRGFQGGTYMHRKIAYDFAAWLSIEFKDFIYTVFDEYMKNEIKRRQRELDYFWDREDRNDLYNRKI